MGKSTLELGNRVKCSIQSMPAQYLKPKRPQKMHHTVNQSLRDLPGAFLADRLSDTGQSMAWVARVIFGLAWLSCAMPTQSSEILSNLNRAQQNSAIANCTTLQFTDGAEAYRDCLREHIAAAEAGIGEEPGILAALSIDEQYSVQRACAGKAPAASKDYDTCILDQLAQMDQESRPALSLASKDEQFVIAQQCYDSQTNAGARAYRECVNTALSPLKSLPVADFSQLAIDQRNAVKLQCSSSSGDVSTYRQCLLNALGIAFVPPAAIQLNNNSVADSELEPVAIASDTSTNGNITPAPRNPDTSVATPQVATQSALTDNVASLDSDLTAEPNVINTENTTEPARPETSQPLPESHDNSLSISAIKSVAAEYLSKAKSWLVRFSPVHWLALLVALSLPLIFLIVRSTRGSSSRLASAQASNNHQDAPQKKYTHKRRKKRSADARTHAPGRPDLAPGRPDPAAGRPNPARGRPDFAPGRPDPAPALNEPAPFDEDVNYSLDETHMVDIPVHVDNPPSAVSAQKSRPAPQRQPVQRTTAKDTRHFGDWLIGFEAGDQQEYAIEFLVYWMAYADNRFDPALKQQVFETKNPDTRTLIKRWAFMKDANAFADAIGFLQTYTTETQRQQIIDLLMALLVTEHALTPVQNNLLRFISDAFGIGNAKLNQQFTRAYGSPLPPIPRPDKTIWWAQMTTEQKLRWDARAVARQPDEIRFRIALGQPLRGELDRIAVDKSFSLAMRRCHHERVNKLGEREKTLLETQRRKFEATFNALLEPMT
ncbi:MAG: hypothetical protein AB8B87_25515 [Granulosicoccus sp.]